MTGESNRRALLDRVQGFIADSDWQASHDLLNGAEQLGEHHMWQLAVIALRNALSDAIEGLDASAVPILLEVCREAE